MLDSTTCTTTQATFNEFVSNAVQSGSIDGRRPSLKSYEYESVTLGSSVAREGSPTTQYKRSVSCFELGRHQQRFRFVRSDGESEDLHVLAAANVRELELTASSTSDADSNNAALARKALRYRKIWRQSNGVATSC